MNRDLKIGFLWLGSPGYIVNCAGNLASDVESVIFFYVDGVLPRDILATYQKYIMENKLVFVDVTNISAVELETRILDADLHALVICGWHYRKWIKAAKGFSGIKILTLDNQWKGNLRQILGKVYGRTYLRRSFHSVFVPGARSRIFAEKIGFHKSKVHEGLYVGNNRIFNPPGSESRQDFLFPGRLIAEKNVEELLRGYQEYRKRVTNPWNLKIAGWGPLENRLMNQQGIDFLGNLSQLEMAEAMRTSKFTILPSLSERWGVVVHESVLAGTPVICSEECGAADYFVIDMNSGFLLNKPNFKNIANALYDAHMQPEQDFEAMSKACIDLAGCFTPEMWSKTIIQMICEHTKTWEK